ncbi:hypothetical protein [uncultured Sneathiella sp.]|uniref:hypothetical protein n=1 Tax=uncultured Sneathiella sp. TaxID=879315 RepID=UPI0030EDF504
MRPKTPAKIHRRARGVNLSFTSPAYPDSNIFRKGFAMRHTELTSIVDGLKTEFSNACELDRKSIAGRANGACLAALDLLLDDAEAVDDIPTLNEQAQSMRTLSDEFRDITGVIGKLATR